MSKVTRIATSKNLTQRKLDELTVLAARLGKLRKEVWHRFGSINGVGFKHRTIRDKWLAEGCEFDVPARLWKETLRDTIADITAYREAAKREVRRAVWQRTDDNAERKQLFALLKSDRWMEDNYLRRMMRKHFKHGQTAVANQIIVDTGSYKGFELGGKAWIKVQGLERGQRIAIPLNTTHAPTGTLRLIIRDGRVEVHCAVDAEAACVTRPTGEGELGIDKGYTEAFTDSEGSVHGDGLGELLSAESDWLKQKYQRRNKLKAIAEKAREDGDITKAEHIERNNLGRKKLNRRKARHTANVRNVAFKAAHSIVDKADTVAAEDLTSPIKSRKKIGKNQNRRLSGWVKGTLAESLVLAAHRRGATVVHVNAAYTSQMDSATGLLEGRRVGDKFYRANGVVMDADVNAARNILSRLHDDEIGLYTPYREVRRILQERTKLARLGLLNQDTSRYAAVSELPICPTLGKSKGSDGLISTLLKVSGVASLSPGFGEGDTELTTAQIVDQRRLEEAFHKAQAGQIPDEVFKRMQRVLGGVVGHKPSPPKLPDRFVDDGDLADWLNRYDPDGDGRWQPWRNGYTPGWFAIYLDGFNPKDIDRKLRYAFTQTLRVTSGAYKGVIHKWQRDRQGLFIVSADASRIRGDAKWGAGYAEFEEYMLRCSQNDFLVALR